MLDLIRANAQSWGVKIAFGIIILVFVFWGVGGLTGGPSTVILTVNGEPITIQEFQRKYEQLEQQVRAQYPDLDAAGLKAMQLKQQLIQNLILENLIMQEAKRVGIVVTPVELRKLIESFPAFHNEEGKFDPDAYVRVIKAQRNTPGNFEAELRNNMLMNKLRADVTAGAFVPEAEVRDLFRYEGERRILEYVFYPLEDYTSKVTVDDAQIKDYYEANQASFTVPPQADVEYLLIGAEALAAAQNISDAAVSEYYEKNAAQFATPEMVRARHILILSDAKASAEDQPRRRPRSKKSPSASRLAKISAPWPRKFPKIRAALRRAANSAGSRTARWFPNSTRLLSPSTPASFPSPSRRSSAGTSSSLKKKGRRAEAVG